jgi:hypothetical protein
MRLDMDFICLPMSGGKRHRVRAQSCARDGDREKTVSLTKMEDLR